jgi:hypothetical protein
MFVRVVRVGQYRYMQVVESVWRRGKRTPGHKYLWPIGRYDEQVLAEARRLLRELVEVRQAQVVIADLEEASGPGSRNSSFGRQYRRGR